MQPFFYDQLTLMGNAKKESFFIKNITTTLTNPVWAFMHEQLGPGRPCHVCICVVCVLPLPKPLVFTYSFLYSSSPVYRYPWSPHEFNFLYHSFLFVESHIPVLIFGALILVSLESDPFLTLSFFLIRPVDTIRFSYWSDLSSNQACY